MMRSNFQLFLKSSLTCLIPVLVLITAVSLGTAHGELFFFRATKDQKTHSRNPGKYQKVLISQPYSEEKLPVYVEHAHALTIRDNEIKRVVIETEEVYTDSRETAEALLGLKREGHRPANSVKDYVYVATFYLSPEGAKKFKNFANKHDQQLVELKLQSRRIGLGNILIPIEGNNFTSGLLETNPARIKQIFAPLKDKVTWK